MIKFFILSVMVAIASCNIFDDILTLNSVSHADTGNKEHTVLIEGDIATDNGVVKRAAITNGRLWPKVIPYDVSSHSRRDTIVSAINALQKALGGNCLTFRPKRSGDSVFMKFVVDSGCWSYVGNIGRSTGQTISIGRGCEHTGIIQHEIMHALGFWHEQSRPDRDKYVTILKQNIVPSMIHNFNIHQSADTQGIDYDYGSVMHYGSRAFSRNGQDTIKSKQPGKQLGQRGGPSKFDIEGIKKLYKCSGGGGSITTKAPPGPGPVTGKTDLDFESGIPSNWMNVDWRTRRGCPRLSKEPKLDRNNRQGTFAYVDSSTNKRRGVLTLKAAAVVKRDCRVKVYVYPGSNLFTFQIKVKRGNAKRLVQVYKLSGRQSQSWKNQWRQVTAQLKRGDKTIQFFARVKKVSSQSGVAIDDITFDNCF